VLGQLAGPTAIPYIRAGKLIPVLIDYMPDVANYFVYFGSRKSQPARVRAFVDLALERLSNNSDYQLTKQELAQAKKRIHALKITCEIA
jgi:DNA-binding transcriptional LysR family regulator